MSVDAHPEAQSLSAQGKHFSCSMTAVLVGRVREHGGDGAVAELLRLAGSDRSARYLTDIANWISFDEGAALWRAGALVTHHPEFARAVGEDAARYLNASPVANLLRQLGSLEVVYGQIATTASKYSTATILEAVDCGPGFAEIHATPVQGFPRDANHCAWTCGILTQPAILFGLPPAVVHHEHCAAYGAARCEYRVTWVVDGHSAQTDGIGPAPPDQQLLACQLHGRHFTLPLGVRCRIRTALCGERPNVHGANTSPFVSCDGRLTAGKSRRDGEGVASRSDWVDAYTEPTRRGATLCRRW